jgi:hypothetical protein
VQLRSRSYHSARSGPALDDSRDEYCIIKYVENLEKNTKEKKRLSEGEGGETDSGRSEAPQCKGFFCQIVSEVENDGGGECQETCSGPWHVNQNDPHYSSQDMKLPKISARWVHILSDEEMKKERVRCTRPTVVMIVVDS